jgi:chlorite dismutase
MKKIWSVICSLFVVLFSVSFALAETSGMQIERAKILADTGVYGTFILFDVSKEWAAKGIAEKNKGADEVKAVLDAHKEKVLVDSYLTLGLTNSSFFLLRLNSYELLNNQNLIADLMGTGLGRYLTISHTFTGVTKKLNYAPKFPDLLEKLKAGKYEGEAPKYVIVIPTRKDAEWWNLSEEERVNMMAAHTEPTLAYLRSVKRKLYHSTGLSDTDFITYFETNTLVDFNDLVISLRKVKEDTHNIRLGSPTMLGTIKDMNEILNLLKK